MSKWPEKFEQLSTTSQLTALIALRDYQADISDDGIKLFSEDFPDGKLFAMGEFIGCVCRNDIEKYMEIEK